MLTLESAMIFHVESSSCDFDVFNKIKAEQRPIWNSTITQEKFICDSIEIQGR